MKNYFIIKEVTNGAHIVLNGFCKFITKEAAQYNTVFDLAKKYNTSKDKNERAQIEQDVQAIFLSPVFTQLAKSPDFSLDQQGRLYYKNINAPIPLAFANYLKRAIDANIRLDPYINFWKNLVLNPDSAVQEQLFSFLENNGHPITDNGYFLAYKAVEVKKTYDKNTGKEISREIKYDENTGYQLNQPFTHLLKYTPKHKGPYGDLIEIGKPVSMPREECDSNPNITCSEGKCMPHYSAMSNRKLIKFGKST